MTIDSHHHFWRYTPDEYGWLTDEMSAIRRDFQPSDLEVALREANVEGVVTVQARHDAHRPVDGGPDARHMAFSSGV